MWGEEWCKIVGERGAKYGIDSEAVAVKYCCKQFEYFVLGERGLVVRTDHQPLAKALAVANPATARLRRLVLQISTYEPEIEWIAGTQNMAADAANHDLIAPALEDGDELASAMQEAHEETSEALLSGEEECVKALVVANPAT